ncbi:MULTISPECIES: hypothetical protein [unclassified Microcoleus]|uniref:hypothetical protein n=1 Tax=unclassified Microcoleus TaxID=2642155 RepID=UPI002FD02A25
MVDDYEACKSSSVDSEQSEFIFKFSNALQKIIRTWYLILHALAIAKLLYQFHKIALQLGESRGDRTY